MNSSLRYLPSIKNYETDWTIFGISYFEEKPILGLKKIIIGEHEKEEIIVASMEISEFKEQIKDLN